ncbi:flagellar biosynthesis protein FlhF [Bacillus sp. 1NLA3E]|uniref:flagellar biosynthesis protein FlhF n=1 Tax=Bacillus sp. 1NLA3E TaxID=666686 RepID=UPI000247F313|nr:flagellar biosynthesis protein FlhF [Bacillus sp. 1NLA3E]AGK55358.1 flagellar biosynthesis protein FlhF [Bacillus sp. 1NLA3E]
MKTKRIIAESMPLALKMVRQELGENAIIVNTRTIKTGGVFGLFSKQKYEVTAYTFEKDGNTPAPQFSLELKDKAEKTFLKEKDNKHNPEDVDDKGSGFHKQPQKLYSYYSQPPVQKEQAVVAPTPIAETENPLLDELQDLRKLMMNYVMSDKKKNVLPRAVTKWSDRLKEQGVEDDVVLYIVNRLLKQNESLKEMTAKEIKQEIILIIKEIITKRVPENNNVRKQTLVINMIGPTGVGKTTTIAKLATEQILKQKRRVAMITTDVYRIAAVEQLKTYAGILNVPIEVVRSSDELGTVLNKLSNYDLIYMDTTGRNYKEQANRESISEFLHHPLESDNYLVLSLTTKFEDLKILLNEFLDSPVQKLILTKFDETSSYGSILNIAYKYPYQIAYITNGQSVPEDITAIDAALLTSYLLGEEIENGSSSKPSRIHAQI